MKDWKKLSLIYTVVFDRAWQISIRLMTEQEVQLVTTIGI
jgi:hypothetical protein